MNAAELERIVTQKDLIAAEGARDHAGPHSVTLSSLYWRTHDWVERSVVVQILQDQKGPHLRSLFFDFLRAPDPEPSMVDHFELTKAACLVHLSGKNELFDRYYHDRALLRRAVDEKLAEEGSAPATQGSSAAQPAGFSGSARGANASGPSAAQMIGAPTPIAAPPGAGGKPSGKVLVGAALGCGCLALLGLVGAGMFYVLAPDPGSPSGSDYTPPTTPTAPAAPASPATMPAVTPPTPTPVVPPPPTSTLPAVPAPTTAPAAAGLPTAQMGPRSTGTNSAGARFWIVDYENTGSVAISRPAIIVSLFDEAGARVAEQTGYSRQHILAPGEKTTVLVLVTNAPSFAREEVQLRPPEGVRFQAPEVALEVVEQRPEPGIANRIQIVGTVRNPSAQDVRFASILVVGRNAGGIPVSYGTGIASIRDLVAGASSGFAVRMGTFETEAPTTYEVSARARGPR